MADVTSSYNTAISASSNCLAKPVATSLTRTSNLSFSLKLSATTDPLFSNHKCIAVGGARRAFKVSALPVSHYFDTSVFKKERVNLAELEEVWFDLLKILTLLSEIDLFFFLFLYNF
jgi:predicted ATP-grasp superfamily ATP-dependent carboligase